MRKILQPAGWPRPKGYANGIAAQGRFVFTAGVLGWDRHEHMVSDDFAAQFRQALINTRAILAEGDAKPDDIVRITMYVTDRRESVAARPAIGAAWREIFGKVFPAMAVVQVAALVEPGAKIEMETTAVIADA